MRARTYLIYDANCGARGRYQLTELEATSRERACRIHNMDADFEFDYASGELEPELRGYVSAGEVPAAGPTVIVVPSGQEARP